MRLVDIGVFCAATTTPAVLFWLGAAIRGRSATVHLSMLAICGVFGFGVAVIARAKGWV